MMTLIALPTIQVFAINPQNPAPTNGLSKAKNDHLYLFEKDEATWQIVENPAWAKMNINNKQQKFVFNAHGVTPEQDYELICYVDPWPGTGSILLGTGTADQEGNVHIKAPINYDELHALIPETQEGSKIWLVPAQDFDEVEKTMINWSPDRILFEFDLLHTAPVETE